MKKYILFFISIGILLGAILVYNVVNVEESKKETFSESGYILNGSTNRYYFYQDETYTTSYNNQIVFYDTEGAKVTLDNSNFIHYTLPPFLQDSAVHIHFPAILALSHLFDRLF